MVTLLQLSRMSTTSFVAWTPLFAKRCWKNYDLCFIKCVLISFVLNVLLQTRGALSARQWNTHRQNNQWVLRLAGRDYLHLCSVILQMHRLQNLLYLRSKVLSLTCIYWKPNKSISNEKTNCFWNRILPQMIYINQYNTKICKVARSLQNQE